MKRIFFTVVFTIGLISAFCQTKTSIVNNRKQQNHPKENINRQLINNQLRSSETVLFSENFDNQLFPPQNWNDSVYNQNQNWKISDGFTACFDSVDATNESSAFCEWSHYQQNEWLLSPKTAVFGFESLELRFYAGFSRYWLSGANLKLYVKTPHLSDWQMVWNANTDTVTGKTWKWRYIVVDLYDYRNDTVEFAWQYVGKNGDLVGLDHIQLVGGPANSQTEIKDFWLTDTIGNNVLTNKAVSIKTNVDSVYVEVLNGTDMQRLVPHAVISSGATITPNENDTLAFEHHVAKPFFITAADGITRRTWQVQVSIANINKDANILTFSLPTQTKAATVDTLHNTVKVEVAYSTDLQHLTPTFTLSSGAHSNPKTEDTISVVAGQAFEYQVFAQAPTVPVQLWRLTVSVRDYETDIVSFSLPNETENKNIDSVNHKIDIELSYGSDISAITPEIVVSEGANISPASGAVVTFTAGVPKIFTVTAANGTVQEWAVTVTISPKFLFREFFDDDATFPPMSWNLISYNQGATWLRLEQPSFSFDSIVENSSLSALCPWQNAVQDEWLISPSISTRTETNTSFQTLNLTFYAGFSRYWLSAATLKCLISTDKAATWTEIWNAQTDTSTASDWQWRKATVNLNEYATFDSVQFAWQYVGKNGDLAGLDGVILSGVEAQKEKKSGNAKSNRVYPNPFTKTILIITNSKSEITIWTANGNQIYSSEIENNSKIIDTENWASGIYFMRIINNTETEVIKLVKQ